MRTQAAVVPAARQYAISLDVGVAVRTVRRAHSTRGACSAMARQECGEDERSARFITAVLPQRSAQRCMRDLR